VLNFKGERRLDVILFEENLLRLEFKCFELGNYEKTFDPRGQSW